MSDRNENSTGQSGSAQSGALPTLDVGRAGDPEKPFHAHEKRGRGVHHALRYFLRVALDRAEPVIEGVIRLCGWSAILFVFLIFFFVFREAAPVLFGKLNLVEFFTSTRWQPSSEAHPSYGTLALLVGTLSVTALAMVLAVPLGLGAAVYVSEFAHGKVKEALKVLIELLAAIPSIVWGFIGYMVLGPVIIYLFGAPVGVNLLNGGIILALMSVPIIVSVGEDALKAVPDSYREAALSLGASRWEIVYRSCFRPPGTDFWRLSCWASAARSERRWPF